MKSRYGLPGRQFALWILLLATVPFSMNAQAQAGKALPKANAVGPAAGGFGIGAKLAIPGTNKSQLAAASDPAFNTDFTMLPSVLTTSLSLYGAGPQMLNLLVFCFDLSTGNILPNCQITAIVPSAEADSGGHLHNTNRPAGSVSPNNGNTGPSGFLPVVYTAPEASGITDLTLTGFVNGLPPTSGILTIGIEVDGLAAATVNGLIVDTQSNMHDNNNGNALPDTISALQATADEFADRLAQSGTPAPNPPLHVTALSLPQGGLFDYQTEWSPPHKLHRTGTDADVSPILTLTPTQRTALVAAFVQGGFRAPVPGERPEDVGTNHWHLKLD